MTTELKNEDILHENDNYIIRISYDYEWLDEYGNLYEVNYAVINKNNGLVEYYSPQLIAALFNAENFNHVLIDQPHMWQAQARKDAAKVGDIIEGEGNGNSEVH